MCYVPVVPEMRQEDRCPDCGSTDLFSGWYDADGLAVPLGIGDPTPPGVTWQTSCNQCGWLGQHHVTQRVAR